MDEPAQSRTSVEDATKRLPSASCSVDFVRIWSTDDDGSQIHLMASGCDFTICGHDAAGDELVHKKPPQKLYGRRRVTCDICLRIIADVKDYLNPPNS